MGNIRDILEIDIFYRYFLKHFLHQASTNISSNMRATLELKITSDGKFARLYLSYDSICSRVEHVAHIHCCKREN